MEMKDRIYESEANRRHIQSIDVTILQSNESHRWKNAEIGFPQKLLWLGLWDNANSV